MTQISQTKKQLSFHSTFISDEKLFYDKSIVSKIIKRIDEGYTVGISINPMSMTDRYRISFFTKYEEKGFHDMGNGYEWKDTPMSKNGWGEDIKNLSSFKTPNGQTRKIWDRGLKNYLALCVMTELRNKNPQRLIHLWGERSGTYLFRKT